MADDVEHRSLEELEEDIAPEHEETGAEGADAADASAEANGGEAPGVGEDGPDEDAGEGTGENATILRGGSAGEGPSGTTDTAAPSGEVAANGTHPSQPDAPLKEPNMDAEEGDGEADMEMSPPPTPDPPEMPVAANTADASDAQSGGDQPFPGGSSNFAPPETTYQYVSVGPPSADPAVPPRPTETKKNSAVPPTRQDRFQKLELRIANDPWDTDAWLGLLGEAMRRGEQSIIQDSFERFLKQFPTSARHWIAYADFEIARGDVQRIESIFARCLRSVLDVDLWNCYLSYVRKRYNNDKDATHRSTVQKAFEFVLQNVGLDKDSGPLWGDYIAFLKTGETRSTYEEQQKMDLLRKTYHRALSAPIANIEQLWRDYDSYENGLSRMTAKKFISDRSPGYMLARSAQRELRIRLESLDIAQKNWLAKPPTWSEKECQILMTWKRYIEWERSNPMKLDDKSGLANRVVYAYKRALLMLRMFPELWHEASAYLSEVGRGEDAVAMLKQGVEAVPTSILLHMSLADLLETRNQVPAAKQLYETLLTNLEQSIADITSRAEAEKIRVVSALAQQHKAGPPGAIMDGEEREERRQKEKAAVDKVEAARLKDVGDVKESLALAWIFYMRFSRRTENIKAARAVFSRARKSPNCLPHVYVASALMEHYISKDPQVAGRIFELGLKNIPEGSGELLVGYTSEYLDWLISQNDDNNTRALFERSLLAVPADKARVIWSKFAAYEAQFGDLGSLLRVEKRRAEAFPEDNYHLAGLSNVADRYTYLDLKVVAVRELGLPALQGMDKAMLLKPKARVGPSLPTADSRNKVDALESKSSKHPLDSFHPERYPRPDFGRYAAHKLEATAVAVAKVKQEREDRPQMPSAMVQVAPPTMPPANQTPVVLPTLPGGGPLPELVARLISLLPPPHQYTGPVLPSDDLIAYIRSLPIPMPGATATFPPQGEVYGQYPPSGASGAWNAPRGGPAKRRNDEDDRGRPKRFRD
ncbi:hypothetical protein DFJ74DRAFT_655243 [Hyaloraphidium curvatum]|nr:hypothetical protein DFJ74DRAFT_655243 [Hyaloraphidium curvatum]